MNDSPLKAFVPFMAGVLFFSGCATSEKDWSRDGVRQDQIRRDLAACKYNASLAGNPLAGANLGFAIGEGFRQKQLVNNCMLAKGYTRSRIADAAVERSSGTFRASDLGKRNNALENALFGRWKTVAITLTEELQKVGAAEEVELFFQPNNLAITKTILQGKPPLVQSSYWQIVDRTLYIGDSASELEPAALVLSGDELTLTFPNSGFVKFRKQRD
jgi:hypothetical protein